MMDYSRRKTVKYLKTPFDILQSKLNFYRNLFCFFAGFLTCLLWVFVYG